MRPHGLAVTIWQSAFFNVCLEFCLLSPMEARRCYAVSDLQLGQWEVVLSARELGLKVRPHRNITSRVSSGFAFLVTRPPAKHPFYNSSVGFTYVSTDIIYKNIYMLLQGVQYLVWMGMEGRRRGIWCSFLFVKILAVKRGFHSFPHFLGNFEQLVLFEF